MALLDTTTSRRRPKSALVAAMTAYKNPAGSLGLSASRGGRGSGQASLAGALTPGAGASGRNPGLSLAPQPAASPSAPPSTEQLIELVRRVRDARAAASSPQAPASSSSGGSGAPDLDWVEPGGRGITYTGQPFTHDTDGLPGFPAVDIFAKPGTAFLAPENGRIIRHSGRGGTSGNVYGYSIYFQGVSGALYFITHLGTRAPIGSYRKGKAIGTVSRWDGGSPHAHVGIRRRGR